MIHKTSRIFPFGSLGFEYFTQRKHHIATVKSWNKLIQNKYVIVSENVEYDGFKASF